MASCPAKPTIKFSPATSTQYTAQRVAMLVQ